MTAPPSRHPPTLLHAPAVLLPSGWQSDVVLSVGSDGTLCDPPLPGAVPQALSGWVLPGMPNAHSHAFQRAMAGWAEHHSPLHPADSFWTWRDAMYRLANRLSPEDLEAIAAQLYLEMLEAGYTAVAEFHYLHHGPDGQPYADPAELSRALLRAADRVGIRITLLPVFYAHGGFDQPLRPDQRRFGHRSVEAFARLLESLSAERHRLGLAAHSLRAVAPDELAALRALVGPLHIHIAEQTAEVEQCLQVRGQRPVAWLLEHAPVDARWCLVHATHTTPEEVRGMAAAGCVVALCPTTEANLGDGLFDLPTHLAAGGALAIGSDSHITVDPREELRLLEYGQRLQRQARNVSAGATEPSTGLRLWTAAARGGAQALGQPIGALQVGAPADLIVLDPEHPRLLGQTPETLLDAFLFSTSAESPVRDVFVGGRQVVAAGRHPLREPVRTRYAETLNRWMRA